MLLSSLLYCEYYSVTTWVNGGGVVGRQAARFARVLLEHPAAIFAVHCCHNYMITHRSELVSPYYLGLWLQVLRKMYPTTEAWHCEFSSRATATQCYLPEQCSDARLAEVCLTLTSDYDCHMSKFSLWLNLSLKTTPSMLYGGLSGIYATFELQEMLGLRLAAR